MKRAESIFADLRNEKSNQINMEELFMKAFCGQNIEFAYIHVMLHT